MQAELREGETAEGLSKKLREMLADPVPYDEKKMMRALANQKIKSVRVFKKRKRKTAKGSRRKNRGV